jgi:acyl carrier protein phosphodiesterase
VNYLAHLYLSGNDRPLRLGNFIADHLKGLSIKKFEADIQRGIRLHHAIDAYTDSHPVVAESKARLQPIFRKYAPVIVDVFYDHFLARNWQNYHPTPLPDYAQSIYTELYEHYNLLPERAQGMLPYMVKYDWLTNYAMLGGIQRVMNGMSRRTRFDSGMEKAPALLDLYQIEFEDEFNRFFPDLQAHVAQFLEKNP